MPKSRIRKKRRDNRPQQELAVEGSLPMESPRWLAPAMVTTFLIGLAWIVTFYISETRYPVPGIGAWNMVVGFAIIGIGFSLATRWR
ncbi:MAG: cell division protein CrgA [Actinobacteria bacterium]|nr:cell division protein CrgA [Actinomycetota bacterium]